MKLVLALCLTLAFWGQGAEAAECACATQTLHVRSGAGTTHGIIGSASPGTCMPHNGQKASGNGYTWLHVEFNGHNGWAASNWLRVGPCTSSHGGTSCFGNVNHLHPTGKHSGGVAGSNSDVDARMRELNGLKSCIDQVAKSNCIEAALIGAVASRETNGGASLTASGVGIWDHNGYGIMQCDLHTSGLPCKDCAPRSCCHIEMLVHRKIVPDIHAMKAKFPSWSIEQQVQAAIAAYNTGRSRVHGFSNIDAYTTGHDYSNDVIARAQHLKNKYGWS
ncbi:lysozyme g-like [Littorina saxatilis]|uniref:lysozyme g-like n=1 Tax=Littorina saxatilis TaxID=31220 RepID=UPI0038B4FAD2